MNAISEWLRHSVTVLGVGPAPAWMFMMFPIGIAVEGWLTRRTDPRLRSAAAMIGNLLRLAMSPLPIARIPVVGPSLVRWLEVVSNVDLDGDGKVGDPPRPGVVPIVAILALSATLTTGCKTGGAADGGPVQAVTDGVIHCAEQATHVAALGILDDVSTALVSGDWQGELMKLAVTWGQAAAACAVQEVAGDAAHAFQASGDARARLKAERGRAYLAAHPVAP